MDDEYIVVRNSLTMFHTPTIEGMSSIVLENEETEIETQIGEISFFIYNSKMTDICEAADELTEGQSYVMTNAVAHIPKLKRNKTILSIEKILIDSKYRAKGYGNEAFNELLKFAATLSVDYITLQPAPPYEEASKDEIIFNLQIKRLIHFYERFGFQTYDGPEDEPIMVLDMKRLKSLSSLIHVV